MKKDVKMVVSIVAVVLALVAWVVFLFATNNPDEKELFRREANEYFRSMCRDDYNKYAGESLELDELDKESREVTEQFTRFRKWFLEKYNKIKERKN